MHSNVDSLRIAKATRQLEEAETPLAVTRARELCPFTRWDPERLLPHLFGQQTKLVHEAGPDLGEMLREANRRVGRVYEGSAASVPGYAEVGKT